MAKRALTVEIVGDSSSLEKAFRRVDKDTDRLGKQIHGVGVGAAKSLVLAGAAAAGGRP